MNTPQKPFVTKIDLSLAKKLKEGLEEKGFSFTKPDYTLFSARKKGISCTLYTSGKLVVQGKESTEFIEFYLEPEILQTFTFTHADATIDTTPHIGIDESGKGDLFGPLCIAGVYGDERTILTLQKMGICDSKKISDKKIRIFAKEIKKTCPHHVIRINPLKYNELYRKFQNLNHLLAWGHATTIESLMETTGCDTVLIDQFAAESVVKNALKQKKLNPNLSQRHRAEEDLVVAAASILARDAFLQGLENLEKTYNIPLCKGGASKANAVGRQFVREHGKEALANVAKMHFKNVDAIVPKPPE